MITLAGGSEFPRFDAIQTVGSTILGLGVMAHLVIQLYRQVSGQSSDLVAPLIRGAIGFALLASADDIGTGLFHASSMMAEGIAGEATLRGLDAGIEAAFSALTDDFGLSDIVSLRFWVSLISLLLVLLAFVVKWAIIDILWPVYFGLVTMMGGLAIPLSFIPGIETMRGWFLTLIEAALWPIVFQVVVAIMAGTIGHGLDEPIRQATEELQFKPLIEALATLATLTLLSLGTPIISARLMRGQTAGDVFGRAASRMALMTAFVGARMANAAGSKAMGAAKGGPAVARDAVNGVAGRQAMQSAGIAGAVDAARTVNPQIAAGGPSDKRFYNPPGWKADEGREYHQLRRDGHHGEAAALKASIDARNAATGAAPKGNDDG